jgi:hypothetical protein
MPKSISPARARSSLQQGTETMGYQTQAGVSSEIGHLYEPLDPKAKEEAWAIFATHLERGRVELAAAFEHHLAVSLWNFSIVNMFAVLLAHVAEVEGDLEDLSQIVATLNRFFADHDMDLRLTRAKPRRDNE